jgi:hypothetical protein
MKSIASRRLWQGLGAAALGVVSVVIFRASAESLERVPGATRVAATYAKDVAPIINDKCAVCHRAGSIAPMELETYDQVVKAAAKIRGRVISRTMPPWHLDKTVGIQEYKNDKSLTQAEINTIVDWIDNKTPMGNAADMPPKPKWPDPGEWALAEKFGKPDLIVKSTPFNVMASGQDKWWRPTTETGVTEPRWVRAIEVKPSIKGRKAVHHVLTTLIQNEGGGITGLASSATAAGAMDHGGAPMPALPTSAGLFMEWAVGKVGEIFPENAGKLLLPGSRIRWEVHYYAPGVEVPNDEVELGVWFYPKEVTPKYRTILRMFNAVDGELDIPPNSKSMVQNFYVLPAPARIENFQPHMHMRGKAFAMEAIYPNGRKETLSMVSNFQWRWHVNYIFADHVAPLLPKGTTLVFTAWHDNTSSNINNPDYRQWIGWGDRTVDEMAHAWVDVTYLEQADFDKMVAERAARPTRPTGGQK